MLTGILQVLAGWLRLGVLMRFVPLSVITGVVNALATLIFMAQLNYVAQMAADRTMPHCLVTG